MFLSPMARECKSVTRRRSIDGLAAIFARRLTTKQKDNLLFHALQNIRIACGSRVNMYITPDGYYSPAILAYSKNLPIPAQQPIYELDESDKKQAGWLKIEDELAKDENYTWFLSSLGQESVREAILIAVPITTAK